MKPWMIVLSSAVVAVVAAAGVALPELALRAHSAVGPSLASLVPMLIVTVLAGYTVCAILLTVANLVGNCVLLRYRLADIPPHRGPLHPDWNPAFETYGLRQLWPAPAAAVSGSDVMGRTIALRSRFDPQEPRREMARLYYIWAARTHVFSALIVLAGAAALGLARQHSALPGSSAAIPMVPAVLILLGLVLLAVIGRIALDVAVEPLVELLSRLPMEPVEIALLRRAVDLLEASPAAKLIERDSGPTAAPQIPDRVIGVFEDGRRALLDAIERLKRAADELATGTRSAIEGLEAAVRDSQRRPLAAGPANPDIAGLSRLEDAITALTAALDRAPASALASALAAGSELPLPSREPAPQLAQELKKLLEEIGTAS
jgi:hypothetical protein